MSPLHEADTHGCLAARYKNLWSGYTNEEVVEWLKAQLVVYPVCIGVWQSKKQVFVDMCAAPLLLDENSL